MDMDNTCILFIIHVFYKLYMYFIYYTCILYIIHVFYILYMYFIYYTCIIHL